jgi:hypothetical protein
MIKMTKMENPKEKSQIIDTWKVSVSHTRNVIRFKTYPTWALFKKLHERREYECYGKMPTDYAKILTGRKMLVDVPEKDIPSEWSYSLGTEPLKIFAPDAPDIILDKQEILTKTNPSLDRLLDQFDDIIPNLRIDYNTFFKSDKLTTKGRPKTLFHIGSGETTTLNKESITGVIKGDDENRKKLKRQRKKVKKRYTEKVTPYSADIPKCSKMKDITTIKISKATRQLIEDLKVMPQEPCNNVVFRVLGEAKSSRKSKNKEEF